jgi:hypothetical protein
VIEPIEVRDNGVDVVSAPERSSISLELIAKATRGLTIDGGRITVGSGSKSAVYRVTGWDAKTGSLLVERVFAPVDWHYCDLCRTDVPPEHFHDRPWKRRG